MASPQLSATLDRVPVAHVVLWGLLALYGVVTLVGLVTTGRLSVSTVATSALVTAVAFGPVAWLVRARVEEPRRERLTLVAVGAAILAVPIALGLGLAVGWLPWSDNVFAGILVGFAVVAAAERLVVPERLRSDP